jgi:rhodanese-related sulfurtransferase
MSKQAFEGRDAISVQELAQLRRNQQAHLLIDVREADELTICQVEGALHIPMGNVPARLSDVPRDAPVVVMCHHGGRSRMVVNLLQRAGFDNALNLEGGIDAWTRQIDNTLRLY